MFPLPKMEIGEQRKRISGRRNPTIKKREQGVYIVNWGIIIHEAQTQAWLIIHPLAMHKVESIFFHPLRGPQGSYPFDKN